MARLGDICIFQSGGTPSKNEPAYFDGNIPWISTVALNGGIIGSNDAITRITEKAIAESAAKIVPAESIMVGTRVGIGKVAINAVPMSTSQDIISLVGIDETIWSKKYLCQFIASKNEYLNSQARGATIKGIKIEVLSELELPNISLSEQQQVSKVLDVVSKAISLRKQQLAKLEELVKARFVEMFGELTQNSMNWKFTFLSELCDVRDGTHDSPKYCSDGYPLLTSKNFTNGVVDFSGAKYISKEDFDAINQRSKVDVGDIVMPMIGTIGHPVLINTNVPFAIKNVALIKFLPNGISNVFIREILDSSYFRKVVQEKNRGNTQKFIALGDIRELMIPLVPIAQQDIFSDFVGAVNFKRLTIQRGLDKLEMLKRTLMQEYFE